jgi:hypothetical protein
MILYAFLILSMHAAYLPISLKYQLNRDMHYYYYSTVIAIIIIIIIGARSSVIG